MNNADYVEWVKTLTSEQLLDEVMVNAEYLTDGYYSSLGKALCERYEELKKTSQCR